MEHKAWLWKRKSSEKTIILSEKSDLLVKEQEKEKAQELERSLQDLNGLLSSARIESDAKDNLLAKQAKVAEEAIAGWEKSEAEAVSLKKQLDDALHKNAITEEKMDRIEEALKDYMQQLNAAKKEQDHITSDAAEKISREQEKVETLEEKLIEANKRIAKLGAEYSNLYRTLEMKEKLIEELNKSKALSEANFNEVMARLDSTEKSNASLKYEVSMLQKELEIRNEDKEFNLKSADAAHKQHLESLKKITKLEAECQRLRVMIRKRLPGPAALAKMRSEVQLLDSNATETRKKRSNATIVITPQNLVSENCYDASVLERLQTIEDENKILKESLTKKNSELKSSQINFACAASKLSHVEAQLKELAKSSPLLYDHPLGTISEDGCKEDEISCCESWSCSLLSELEHFKYGKPTSPSCRSTAISDLSLMDDFVEMEKLAIISVDKPFESSHVHSGDKRSYVDTKETDLRTDLSEATGKELMLVNNFSDFHETDLQTLSTYKPFINHPSWLQDILRVIIQKHHMTQKSIGVILEEVTVALQKSGISNKGKTSDIPHANGNVSKRYQHNCLDSFEERSVTDISSDVTTNHFSQSNIGMSVCKLIKLVEGIIQKSTKNIDDQNILPGSDASVSQGQRSVSLNGYTARAFLWETSELTAVLQRFVLVCNDLLHGKADLDMFAAEVSSTLDWIVNRCFSLQDVSDMRETIMKQFDREESHFDDDLKAVMTSPDTEINKIEEHHELKMKKEKLMLLSSEMEYVDCKLKVENSRLECETLNVVSQEKDLKEKLKTECARNDRLVTRLPESEALSSLHVKLEALKESKGLTEDQIVNKKLLNNHGSQITASNVELDETHKKFSLLELEKGSNCSEKPETTFREVPLKLESAAAKGSPKHIAGQEEKQLRTDIEIAAASEKLAHCQETILNLGKQLKALASPKDAAILDKVMYSPSTSKSTHRPRLLDQIQAEHDAEFEEAISPKTKEIICTEPQSQPAATSENLKVAMLHGQTIHRDKDHGNNELIKNMPHPSPGKSPDDKLYHLDELDNYKSESNATVLALVSKRPSQKGGLSLLRKLLQRKNKRAMRN
ncbi:filament-like plant protein 7 [Typha latifolia]|uniref:filament-like plant protein 7 n=1 Tax=Typha latifolia TaxID=4733 RepID=UPI003C2C9D21